MAKILIVDDSLVARKALRMLIETQGDLEVCGEATDGPESIERVQETAPDLVLLDFYMPLMNGLAAAREIAKIAPNIYILLCTIDLSPFLVNEAETAGLHGAVSKAAPQEIINGIRAVTQGRRFFQRSAAAHGP